MNQEETKKIKKIQKLTKTINNEINDFIKKNQSMNYKDLILLASVISGHIICDYSPVEYDEQIDLIDKFCVSLKEYAKTVHDINYFHAQKIGFSVHENILCR